jgi:hypothetical protein
MVRRFRSPGGREWKVSVYELPPNSAIIAPRVAVGARKVLCFEAPDIILELADFPENWGTLSDAELVALLRNATVPAVIVGKPGLLPPDVSERPIRT